MRLSARLLAFLLLPLAAPLAAADGTQIMGFGGGDGVASWPTNTNTATLADITANDELLIGVGSYKIAGDPPTHLSWQAVDINGELRGDHRCFQATSALIPLTVSSAALAGVVDGSGNLVVAGHAEFLGSETQQVPVLLRFDLGSAGCVLDDGFSGNGYEVFDDFALCQSASCSFVDVALQGMGPLVMSSTNYRIFALLRVATGSLTVRDFVVSIEPDGSVDTSFGSSGLAEVKTTEGDMAPFQALAVDGRGQIFVLASNFDDFAATLDLDTSVYEVSADGSHVSRLTVESSDTHDSEAGELAIPAAGDLLVSYGDGAEQDLWMIDQTGTHRSPYGGAAAPWRLALQGNARALGVTDNDGFDGVWTQRVGTDSLAPLAHDTTWGSGLGYAFFDVDLGGSDSEVVTKAFLWHGRLIVGGNAASDSGTRAFLVELANSYIFADSLEPGGAWPSWSAARGLQ